MDSMTQLEARVRTLETSVRRSRLLAFLLGLAVVLITAVLYFDLDEGGDPDAPFGETGVAIGQEVVTTERLVLADGLDAVVLVPGPESSLVIETPAGEEVLRLGGSPVRQIKR